MPNGHRQKFEWEIATNDSIDQTIVFEFELGHALVRNQH